MKKIKLASLFSIIIIIIIGSVFKVVKKYPNKITIGEVTHSVFYAPLYVAIENGYFKDENLDVELMLISGADKVSAAVLSGDVEIGFAGAESAIYVYDKGEKDYLKIFSGLTKRDGQFIVSRTKNDNFKFEDLYGKEILVGRQSGMPALNFLNALKNEGIDPSKININYNIDFASLTGAFIGNTGDFVNLFEPNALKLENEDLGYVVKSIGISSGEMPYTTFYARKSYVEKNDDIIKSFQKAIDKALEYVKIHSSKEIASIILPQFPDLSLNELEIIIERYKNADSFLDSHTINKSLLENLENLLIENNLLKKYINYTDLIQN